MDATRDLIATTLRDLTAEWIASGQVATVREIGDGLCEEFAQEALARIHAADPATTATVTTAWTDDWWAREFDDEGRDVGAASFEADVDRLRQEGAPLPDDVPDEELSGLIGGATHMWLVHDGRHHDATAPDGADHFLLMPFFADQIAGHRAARATGECA